MKPPQRLIQGIVAIAYLLGFSSTSLSVAQTKESLALTFRGSEFIHRWSKNGQNEFTPPSDSDLAKWNDMVTLNLHESVTNGDQLAEVANKVLSNYQKHGKILRTDSKPRTPDRPAEHLIVAALGNPNFLEAAFARCVLVNGVGMIAVYSHRVYGKSAGPAMSEWLKTNGAQIEQALMNWDTMPNAANLKKLPQNK